MDDRRVGELAAATGLSVRALHYYEELGLLAPGRNDAGHRVYGRGEVERLYRICLLRRLGLQLHQIGRALDEPGWDLRGAIAEHAAELERQSTSTAALRSRLARLLTDSAGAGEAPTTEDLLSLVEHLADHDSVVQRRITLLVYEDVRAAFEWLPRAFQLTAGQLTVDDRGGAIHGELHAGDGVIWLHPESPELGLLSPRSAGGATASVAVVVDDVDEHAAHAGRHGAGIVYGPVDQPYGYREYMARDLEGGLWSFLHTIS